mgnify:CR=1 FL=1
MKKPFKFVLHEEEDPPFDIIGICSSFNDYRMGWFLNNVMGWKLVQAKDELEIPLKKTKQWTPFSYYTFEHATYHYQVFLLKNKQIMENKKWSREDAEQNKNELIEELKELPISEDNLDWVTKELNQLIDEEEVRQKT